MPLTPLVLMPCVSLTSVPVAVRRKVSAELKLVESLLDSSCTTLPKA